MRSARLGAWTLALVSGPVVGCAAGNEYALHKVNPVLEAKGSARIAVGAHDQRVDVTSGEEDPDFVGVQRATFGNTWNVTTESDRPLANDVSEVVVRALQQQGFAAEAIELPHSLDREAAMGRMRAAGADRALLVTIREFKADTYTNVGFDYAFSATVVGADGRVIAEATAHEGRNLRGSFWNPPAYAKQAVPRALREALEALLNQPAIVSALNEEVAPVSVWIPLTSS